MKIKLNKKANMFWELVKIILPIIILFAIIIAFFPNLFGLGESFRSETRSIAADPDVDGIKGLSDECPCTSGDFLYKGCPKTFTKIEKDEDQKKYNTDTACGKILFTDESKTFLQSPEAIFKHYRSLEIFDDAEPGDLQTRFVLSQVCEGWVGKDATCPTQSGNCDNDEYVYQPLTTGCWIMASEDDTTRNQCGQESVPDGTIIPLKNAVVFPANFQTYYSADNEEDPKNLFHFRWHALQTTGSLLCKQGFWLGCNNQEGKTVIIKEKRYKCMQQEWQID